MSPLGFWKKWVCGDVWDDLRDRRQEQVTVPGGQVFPSGTQALMFSLRHLLKVYLCFRATAVGLHKEAGAWYRTLWDKFREPSKWTVQCLDRLWQGGAVGLLAVPPSGHGTGTAGAPGSASWKAPLLALLLWAASDAINHRAPEGKFPRKMWANLLLVLVNKTHSLEG